MITTNKAVFNIKILCCICGYVAKEDRRLAEEAAPPKVNKKA
tara:strand:- start:309 stop:434 length:126 start_codon:yes stop_codon:yes gene_type:complete